MWKTAKYLPGVLSVAMLFGQATQVTNAMQIPQYDKMDSRDQSHYPVVLVKGAVADLQAAGKTDEALQLAEFFNDRSDNGGFAHFYQNLDGLRTFDQTHVADPNYKGPIYEVEHAMYATMVKDGIKDVSVGRLLEIGKTFKPAYPPQKDKKTPPASTPKQSASHPN